MRGHTADGRTLLVVALSALLLVSAVAVVPTSVGAANGESVTVRQEADGGLTVTIQNGTGPFTGAREPVSIQIAGSSPIEREMAPQNGSYVYQISLSSMLTEVKGLSTTDLSKATVRVTHPANGTNFTRTKTVDLRHAQFKNNAGRFTDSGGLRFDFSVAIGFNPAASPTVPLAVEVGDESRNVTGTIKRDQSTNTSYVVISRGTLTNIGLLDDPREVTVTGRADYVHGSATVNVGNIATTEADRIIGGVSLTNPLFVKGQSYVVDVSPANAKGRYLATLTAAKQELRVDSSALLAASKVTLTVTHDGSTLIDGKTVTLRSRAKRAQLSTDGSKTVITISGLSKSGSVSSLWVETNTSAGIEQYDGDWNATTGNITVSGSIPRSASAVLVDFAKTESVYAQIGASPTSTESGTTTENGTATGPNSGRDQSGGIGQMIRDNLLPIAIVGGIIFVVVAILIVLLNRNSRRSTRGGGIFSFFSAALPGGGSQPSASGTAPKKETIPVTFEAVDEKAGQTYAGADRVIARRLDQGGLGGNRSVNANTSTRIDLAGGRGEQELELGMWQFDIQENGEKIAQKQYQISPGVDREHIGLSVPPHTVAVKVTGGPDNEPLPGAEVQIRPDVGGARKKPTDPSGRVKFEDVPRSATTVSFKAKYEQLPEVETQHRIEQATQSPVSISIAPDTGALEVETVVGSRHWPGVEVEVTPVSEDAKAYADPGTVTTDEDGRKKITNLPTGRYELAAHPQTSAVQTDGGVAKATVEADETTDVTLTIEMSFSLSADQRDRLEALRAEIDELTAVSNRDVAIPYYYGTVLESVLDLVEELESSPERSIAAGYAPGRSVDALLAATDEGIDVVEGAMSERRNIKLFRACESMSPVEESWSGDADLDAFFERASEGKDHQRRALRDRLKETDELLDEKWSEVGEIGPARMVHDRVSDIARQSGSVDDELTVIAQIFVSVCLLDAVESIFEHDALRERLNSGGY